VVHKILLLKRGAMGDILMTSPLIRQLRQNFPDSQIDYCLAKPFESVLSKNQNLNNIIALDDKVFTIKGILKFIKFLISVRRKYDYIFILDKHWYFNLMSRVIGATTIGFCRDRFSKLFLSKSVKYNDVNRYQVLYYLDLLSASNLTVPNYEDICLDLVISEGDKLNVANKLSELQIDKYVVIVNSGGNNQYETSGIRMLPKEKVLQLINGLLDNGGKVILLGGNQDKGNYANYINELNIPMNIYNFAGALSLASSAWLINNAKYFYTTDCGAMHLGVAMKVYVKMTAFFGPTNPRHIIPIQHMNCTVWNDELIYDPNYQLYGDVDSKHPGFFNNIDITKYINYK
jgi:ADP-heptose:LPS heptosyltransferase